MLPLSSLVIHERTKMAPTSGVLYHHHRRSVHLKCFEHVGHIRQIADVIASIQQHRSARRANMGAAAAQHNVLYGSRWVRLRQPNFAGLHLKAVDVALYSRRAIGKQCRCVIGGLGVGGHALVGANHPQRLLGLLEEPGDLQT